MAAPRQKPARGRPFDGRIPVPLTPVTLRRPTADLGDLVALFPPLPSARKVRTAPRPNKG